MSTTGLRATTAVGTDGAYPLAAAPAELPARTSERILWPTSAATSVYFAVVALAMVTQFEPVWRRRCHRGWERVEGFSHPPWFVDSCDPSAAFPVTTGALESAGRNRCEL